MHIKYNEQKYMDKARLLSGLRGATNATCLKFWYDIQGSSAGSLNIYVMDDNGKKLIWTTSGDQKNRWQYGSVEFSSQTVYMVCLFCSVILSLHALHGANSNLALLSMIAWPPYVAFCSKCSGFVAMQHWQN